MLCYRSIRGFSFWHQLIRLEANKHIQNIFLHGQRINCYRISTLYYCVIKELSCLIATVFQFCLGGILYMCHSLSEEVSYPLVFSLIAYHMS